ncbi:Protein O-linked-mannose beta-1,2-N-acetylglucosaminyltransferase 1 [Oopsacas minuta]|uniref:Alpha-1,3-mannosyl-glycoprotein 2-beta-N-acetylglucosaminyltransferase n=1 Tax=Oopsacas minuta TaxID=111878 RepID=A0AAV7K0M8_9METZ|nr:Protein O-linked-mannose beta-1,2-N-acetylglucosaminyltransferase 1 [Oopsacas minuta]
MFLMRTIRLKLPPKLLITCIITTLLVSNIVLLWNVLEYQSADDIHDRVLENLQKSQIDIELRSGPSLATITIDGYLVYTSDTEEAERGLHVVVLNLASARVMATRIFDTYTPGADTELITFLDLLSSVGRIVCMLVVDEASFNLGDNARNRIKLMGSEYIDYIGWRDTWLFAAKVNNNIYTKITESHSHIEGHDIWGSGIESRFLVRLEEVNTECDWKEDSPSVARRRRYFCGMYEGYGQLCDCTYPLPIEFSPAAIERNNLDNVPVAVIASNRPRYLFRMLRTLLSARGSLRHLITVYIDGGFEQVRDVCSLLQVNYKQNTPISSKNARITQHYKTTLLHLFDSNPRADYGIIIEEDLDIAADFFSYFSQTMHLLKEDSSLFCISAWNDQGYEHSSNDPSLLYRVETMPGLGWMLEKTLFVEELLPQWPAPDQFWDWDMWMRTDNIRNGRECVIPDISRTYHFGQSGLNMNPYFHDIYFKNHAINTDPSVKLKNINQLILAPYEQLIHSLIQSSRILDHDRNVCDPDFIPNTKGEVYTIFIDTDGEGKFDTWIQLAKCYHLWDLDARGFHRGLWRFWLKGNHILVIGVPLSDYYKEYMPADLIPIVLEENS